MSSKFFQILTLSVSGLMVNQVYANQHATNPFSVQTEHIYSTWKDNFGSRGYQHATPVTFTYQKNNVDVGLKQAYIISENKTPDLNGRVATWSDVSLTVLTQRFQIKHFLYVWI